MHSKQGVMYYFAYVDPYIYVCECVYARARLCFCVFVLVRAC